MWQDVRDGLMSSVDPCIWACYDFAVIGAAPPGDLIMCNIAGHVGTEPAAPLLLEMIERQEGLAGGYYTGIVTLADGRLHCAKVVGDTATLRAAVRDLDLPGTIGLAHSRSNSGGDVNWSHPFIACDDSLAYIANGSRGFFKDAFDANATACALEASGHRYTALSDGAISSYPVLTDGRCVHISDVMAHAIEERLNGGHDPLEAIEGAFVDLPAEIVGLFIAPSHPDRIFGARYTMPMCVATDAGGSRIASSPTAFPVECAWEWVPPGSVVTIDRHGFEARSLDAECCPLADDIDRHEARRTVLAQLSAGAALDVGQLSKTLAPLSGREHLAVLLDPLYEVLHELEQRGMVVREVRRVPGAQAGLTAPHYVWSCVETTPIKGRE